eukprot:749388-Hanusia_phi.AAC.3
MSFAQSSRDLGIFEQMSQQVNTTPTFLSNFDGSLQRKRSGGEMGRATSGRARERGRGRWREVGRELFYGTKRGRMG